MNNIYQLSCTYIKYRMSRVRERERERGLVRECGGFRQQPRRYSPSPEVRYHRGGRGPSRVPLNGGGNRGEWSVARSRKGKAREQADRQQDRLQEDQRYPGSRERYGRQGRSRVRSRFVSSRRFDSEVEYDYGNQELGHDGRVIIQYEKPVRVRDRDALRYEEGHVLEPRQSHPTFSEKVVAVQPSEGRVQL